MTLWIEVSASVDCSGSNGRAKMPRKTTLMVPSPSGFSEVQAYGVCDKDSSSRSDKSESLVPCPGRGICTGEKRVSEINAIDRTTTHHH